MKMVAIALLRNFKVEVVEGHHVSPTVSIILHMKHGLKVNITKRCVSDSNTVLSIIYWLCVLSPN
ncbi:putative cytochrome P450 [Lupinus albus]|uniref:Putative cytochrome P450 n=1 Tax=Lupinus albus TaxID=3870 RepID=A0A6A4QT75_LUPAL|nr:putative cytochrome P450 [Lupinus albus]